MTDDAQRREAEDQKNAEEAEKREAKNRKDIAGKDLDIQHFDTTVTKLVKQENADGEEEWVEVMSDNLYPGEKLAREETEKEEKRKDELSRARASVVADERRKSDEEALKRHQAANKDLAANKDHKTK